MCTEGAAITKGTAITEGEVTAGGEVIGDGGVFADVTVLTYGTVMRGGVGGVRLRRVVWVGAKEDAAPWLSLRSTSLVLLRNSF